MSKMTDAQRNEQWKNHASTRAVDQIERALITVIAASHQLGEWIDYDALIEQARQKVAQEAADVRAIIAAL